MTDRTLTALYDTKAAAEAAKSKLTAMDISSSDISIHDEGSAGAMGGAGGAQAEGGGMFSGLKGLFGAHEDTHAYSEGLRRGHFLLTAKVDEMKTDTAIQALESSGAVDFDSAQAGWKQSGWTAPAAAPAMAAPTGMARDQDTAIPIVEERLVVGKREVDRGGVRVRSYVVSTPVEEQVTLRDEHVDVERRAVDRPIAAGEEAFRERTLEMTETGEEAVVGKQAYVTEEIGLKKDVGQRTEEVRDTVRHTEVEVERTDAAGVASKPPKRV